MKAVRIECRQCDGRGFLAWPGDTPPDADDTPSDDTQHAAAADDTPPNDTQPDAQHASTERVCVVCRGRGSLAAGKRRRGGPLWLRLSRACAYCDAAPGKPCLTARLRPRTPHKGR